MEKIFWLIPGKLGGRPGPAIEPWDIKAMRESGVTTIVSTDDDCRASSVLAAGLKHVKKFMPSAYPTNSALVDRFVDLVRYAALEVVERVRSGEVVVVHCFAGRDRTGLVLAAALMELESIDAREAFARVRAVRPVAMTGPGVVDVLREYEIRLKAGAF